MTKALITAVLLLIAAPAHAQTAETMCAQWGESVGKLTAIMASGMTEQELVDQMPPVPMARALLDAALEYDPAPTTNPIAISMYATLYGQMAKDACMADPAPILALSEGEVL